jgi:hypothetical protein
MEMVTLTPAQQKAVDSLVLALLAADRAEVPAILRYLVIRYRAGVTVRFPEADAAFIDDACDRFEGAIRNRLAEVSTTGVGNA